MKKFLGKVILNLEENKALFLSLSFSFGVLFGTAISQSIPLNANLLTESINTLNQIEIINIFPEYQNIKEINISTLSTKEGSFMVEFLSTTGGGGNSLHPHAFKITKKNNQVVNIKELPSPEFIDQ